MTDNAATAIDNPRSTVVRRRKGVNWEKWGWVYMRASGVLLVVLIFGHLFVNLFAGEGVTQLDFGFVAGKWASSFWQWYDFLLLWFALVHGSNGIRTIINDYSTPPTGTGIRWLLTPHGIMKTALVVSTVVLLTLGTLVIFTFDPCPAGSPADLLPSFCSVAR
ncbi:succinate dehydrogenase hydrophobic membrane anchor subunit [Naasia lichenicola]|uniref:Succinate dehydrogenase n=1 Tax=Naasia lichenicola TaxID=2565933 RepID=A0A4S4FKF3_9MICO|nr:succinate dehydrogenase hydrophobic membrane anchor subunit [Naasia lichenicola]THG30870.1 succinate dehydrogenase [Naasia lichenicola]